LSNIRDVETWSRYREVVIVPDGYLWYLPFETLYTSEGAQGRPLISKLPVRYVPTASLANAAGPVAGPQAVTGIVAGRMFPGLDLQIAATAADGIRAALPSAQRLTVAPVVPSSLAAANLDRLVVLHELDLPSRSPYGWSPMQLDRGVRGTELESWLTLPWQGPAQLVLPGFRTAADTELKSGANGDDIFLPVCGLMASGAGNILLSRWLVGGQSSFDLIREYVQELPFTRASDAWRRSVLLGARNPIDPTQEPKIRAIPLTEELRGTHPFFWSTYLLIDTGAEPRAAAP
jgi:CHAT domain-containing protein